MQSALLLAALLTPDARLAQAPALPQAPLARVVTGQPASTVPVKVVKSCPCSSLCTCGCNEGEPCTCASVAGPSVIRAVPVWPVQSAYQPAATWAPSYAPAPAFRAFSLPFSGGRSGGC